MSIDNINIRFGEELKNVLVNGDTVSVAAASFSIYAFQALQKELSELEHFNFVFTAPPFKENIQKEKNREFYIPEILPGQSLCGSEYEVKLKNQLMQRGLAKECADWIKTKATFKANNNYSHYMPGMVHIEKTNDKESVAYNNVESFTASGLGLVAKQGFPVIIQKSNYPQSAEYLQWFQQVWADKEKLTDVSSQIEGYFQAAFKDNSPEYIYFVSLYHLFYDFLKEGNLNSNSRENISIKETVIWSKLYNFQQDAVTGIIKKLEKYKGCVLADSVGLGKTFSALGVIKYYELRNKDVLVLCPKKLEANWNVFRYNDKNNVLAADRLRYDVLFHTDLSREHGESNGRRLENVNWGNYGLVVIDESHNFRNNNPNKERENRYQKLLRKIMREGIETKILMLSATPVNNRFNDLKNQLALAYEGNPEIINEQLDTQRGIDQVFSRAERAFKQWSRLDTIDRNTDTLLQSLDFDFFEVLDALTIARSRKHITTYYDTTAIGTFPKRNAPISETCKLSAKELVTFKMLADELTLLNLSIYSPLDYIRPEMQAAYAARYDKEVRSGRSMLAQKDRDNNLKILMRINLLKRIESSVDSFIITVNKMIDNINGTILKLSKHLEVIMPELLEDDEEFDWEAEWNDIENLVGKKIKVQVKDVDAIKWMEDLRNDVAILEGIKRQLEKLNVEGDLKLNRLKLLISKKVNASEGSNKKVIVFTAFADTAKYLYDNLSSYFLEEMGINSALITGSIKKSSCKKVPSDLNAILTCFSPISKEKSLIFPTLNETIDILIATDCISEGQNLQDCDYLVNYDIHWNPVRIIQRFGRIDRLGSTNKAITMVNFWPDISLDQYINLKDRVESKMHITNLASTGDDNILSEGHVDFEYRKIQLKKLKKEVFDLEEMKEGISITDLGLNDFRADLINLLEKYGDVKNLPTGLLSIVPHTEAYPPGVIFILKNISDNLEIAHLNRMHPFYLLYISENSSIYYGHTQVKKILDCIRQLCKGQTFPITELCQEVKKETKEYRRMENISSLLKSGVSSILQQEDENSLRSLLKAGGTTILEDKLKGIDDFKLISFLIVR